MKNDEGVDFVKKVGLDDDDEQEEQELDDADRAEDDDDQREDTAHSVVDLDEMNGAAGDMTPGSPTLDALGNSEFEAKQIKGSMYNKKASMDLKLSVGAMGVTVFDGMTPKDTLRYFELKSWEYDEPSKTMSIIRNIKGKKDERGPARCEFLLEEADATAMLDQMKKLTTETAAQKKADKKEAKAAAEALEKAQKAAEEALELEGDRKFDCGKQSVTVGGTGIQIWEGDKFVASILYQNMDGWTHDEAKNTVEITVIEEGKKKNSVVKLKTKECKVVSEAMMAKAKAVKQAAKAAKKEKQSLAKELEGDWKVVRKQGTLIRESAELDSDEVGIVAYREVLTVDKAEPNYNGSFKTRLRIVKKVVKMRNGEEEEVEGWITMKNDEGVDFVKKVGLDDDDEQEEQELDDADRAEDDDEPEDLLTSQSTALKEDLDGDSTLDQD
eukprot:COSAG01_NODE_2164_length_8260_cov_6.427031_7_plen_441_part_00